MEGVSETDGRRPWFKKNRRLNDHLQRPLARNESFAYLCGFCYVQWVSGVKHFVTLVLKC